MANHLDLEEQEQLDQLKHFWNTWGTLISSLLIVVFGAVSAWNGYQFWQNRQGMQASALLDAVEGAIQAGDQPRAKQIFSDMQGKYAKTFQAGQAGLLMAKVQSDQQNTEDAKATLQWVADHAADEGYQSLARLRLVGLLVEQKSYEAALEPLSKKFPAEFDAIVADRKGDVLMLQDQKQKAVVEYTRAYKAFSEGTEYRRLVEVKLNALGVQPGVELASAAMEASK